MRKNFFTILIVLVFILGLTATSSWRFKRLAESVSKGTFLKLESLGLKKIKDAVPPEENLLRESREFISQDGKLKIRYPADWLVVEDEEKLKALTPQELVKKYNLQTILFGQKFQNERVGQLIVYRGDFNLTIAAIIEDMKKASQEQGWEMEVMALDIKENQGIFEAKYRLPDQTNFYSKEKILISNDRGYIITGLASEKDWPALAQEMDSILNSARLLTEEENGDIIK